MKLDSILKSRDITLPTKVCLIKAMIFPVVMYVCESWTIRKSQGQRIDTFEVWSWRSLLKNFPEFIVIHTVKGFGIVNKADIYVWKLSNEELMLLNCGVGEDSWESLGLQGDPPSPFWRRSALGVLWRECCWSWNSSTLATSCEELTHWKRLWCWEGLGAGGEGHNRGWDGWMASLTRWTWVWVNCGSWWWTGRPGVLQFMGSQRVGHDWATELNWWKFWCILIQI